MDKINLKEKLHVIPYLPGIAEYAAKVRKEILDRKDTNFILAVDLPHGLEQEVMTATKNLPRISVIIDQLFRGIPIIPTSAPVEAVRTFQETGIDLKFIDTSLPVTGNMDDYRYFIDQCRSAGVEKVIKNAEHYGIAPDDLLKSWVESLGSTANPNGFIHLADRAEKDHTIPYSDDNVSPYLRTRFQYMACRLHELLKTGTDVVLVCSAAHVNGILHFLDEPPVTVDDSFVVPTRICAIGERDLLQLTPEIPYFMYLYELYRDLPVDREKWIAGTYCDASSALLAPDTITTIHQFAHSLALTDKELFPDLYNLVASAKYCEDDTFAYVVYELLKSYPPSENISSECSMLNIRDYNFQPLAPSRYLSLKVSVFNDSPRIQKIRKKLLRNSCSTGYFRFTRSAESIREELEFMKYMKARFTAFQYSEENYEVSEFASGFGEGIDIRETIRQKHTGRIYIREPVMENRTCYVLDFRTAHIPPRQTGTGTSGGSPTVQVPLDPGTRFCSSKIFLDKNYPWVGFASSENNHYTCGLMLAFAGPTDDPIPMMDELSYSRPLQSAVQVAMKYAKQVFVFTDSPGEIESKSSEKRSMRILPTRAIPPEILRKAHEFDITCHRYDNRRGD